MTGLPADYQLCDGADAEAAHAFLTHSYWAKGIALADVTTAIDRSIAVSVWHDGRQVGMARVVSDLVTIAYLNDVYVLPDHRGKGIAAAMINRLRADPALAGVGRWLLFTMDMQQFYASLGWREYPHPARTMVIDPKLFDA